MIVKSYQILKIYLNIKKNAGETKLSKYSAKKEQGY